MRVYSRWRVHVRQRRALAGILGAIILFATLFTVGVGFFLFVSNSSQSVNQANAVNENAQVQGSQEKLLVSAGITKLADLKCSQCLWVRANNTGGIPLSIIDLYVTCIGNVPANTSRCGTSQQGQLLSNSVVTGSHFLSQSPLDLNITFPLALGVGASTEYLPVCPGAPPKCTADIAVKKVSFTYLPGEYIVVSLLTAGGNVFSAQYPPPPTSSLSLVTVKTVSTSVAYTQIGGGPQISMLMKASPAATFTCSNGCITLNATIYNLASSTAVGVTISLNAPYVSGTASVTPFTSCTPASHDIPAGSSYSFTCAFSASTGPVGGLASFSGHASGTIGGTFVSSADALSNSVQIGGVASVTTQGAFAANFFFLKYSSCTKPAGGGYTSPCVPNAALAIGNLPSGSYLAGGSNYYVAFYMQITNAFNTTIPILQYSYTFGDPDISGEVFYFLAGTNTTMSGGVYYPNYGASTPTLTSYPTDCSTVNGNNVPTDSKCIYVNPGQTVTLTFAACGYGSASWAWGGHLDAQGFDSGASGCTGNAPSLTVPEGMSLGIVVSFEYKGKVYSQLMPFEGQAYLRSTNPSISCSPTQVVSGSATTCTATVMDTDGGSKLTPTGTVAFSASPVSFGSFSPISCTLSSGSCSTTFTTTSSAFGSTQIAGLYSGGPYHIASAGSTTINIVHATTTSINCVPASLQVGTQTTCTATVTDTNPFATTPTGSVTFSSSPSGSGAFVPASCTLSGSGATATCTTTFTPSAGSEGSITATGSYGGDSGHATSSGSTTVTAIKRTSSIGVSCSPSSVAVLSSTTCTATVSDTSLGVPTTPTGGTVTFAQSPSGSGTFSPATCTTASGTCSVTFTPSVGHVGTVTITATYAGDTDHTGSGPSSPFSLTVIKASPSISTILSANPIAVGQSAYDTATLTGSAQAGGTVTYNLYSGGSCSGGATVISTVTVTNGVVPNSASHTFNSIGAYSWNAVYSGDANNNGATSGCEPLTVNKGSPTMATVLNLATIAVGGSDFDTATISGGSSPTGTVTYNLYSGSSCGGSATVISTVTISGGLVPNSAPHTFNTPGFYSWNAVYNGDSNNNAATSPCEPMTVTKDKDTNAASHVIVTAPSSSTSVTATISTTNAADLIYACEFAVNRGVTLNTPTASGLSFSLRASGQGSGSIHGTMYCWYATTSSALSGKVITFTNGGSSGGVAIAVASFNVPLPVVFDGSASIQFGSSGTASSSVITGNANDIIFSFAGISANAAITTTAGYSVLNNVASSNGASGADEYQAVTSTGTYSPSFTFSSAHWGIVVDAIDPPPSSPDLASRKVQSSGPSLMMILPSMAITTCSLPAGINPIGKVVPAVGRRLGTRDNPSKMPKLLRHRVTQE